MNIPVNIALLGMLGIVGCATQLQELDNSSRNAATTLDAIGATGGYQVRNINVTLPDLSCSGKSYSEARDAFLGGFKRTYIEKWNGDIEAKRLAVMLGKNIA